MLSKAQKIQEMMMLAKKLGDFEFSRIFLPFVELEFEFDALF